MDSHPPGGATAVLAVTVTAVYNLSWFYVAQMAGGSGIMLAWGLIINNLGKRRYPSERSPLTSSLCRDVDSLCIGSLCPVQSAYWISPALVRKVKGDQDHSLSDKKSGAPHAEYDHNHALATQPHHRV